MNDGPPPAAEIDRPLRILHHLPLSNRNWGGIQVQFAHFLAAARKDDRLRNYLTVDRRALPANFADLDRNLAAPSFDYRTVLGVPLPNGARVPMEAARARSWKIDVVLNTNFLGDTRAIEVARRLKAAPVYWERGASWFARTKPLDERFRRGQALVVGNSNASLRMLQDVWEIDAPIEVLTPCVWSGRLAEPPQSRPLHLDRPVRLGFAARLRGFKGGVLALHALAELVEDGVDAELFVAGNGPDETSMRAVITALGLSHRVTMLGHVDDMDAFYANIDILLHPALREPYGNVCAEAAAAGVPVVATRVDGLPEVVDDGVTGVCVTPDLALADYAALGGDVADVYPVVYRPELDRVGPPAIPSPTALADAVRTLIRDPETYQGFSGRAATSARLRFSPRTHLERFEALMRQAADRA